MVVGRRARRVAADRRADCESGVQAARDFARGGSIPYRSTAPPLTSRGNVATLAMWALEFLVRMDRSHTGPGNDAWVLFLLVLRSRIMNKTVRNLLSLFDYSGQWSYPFELAGWNVIQIDIKHGHDIKEFSAKWLLQNVLQSYDAIEGRREYFVAMRAALLEVKDRERGASRPTAAPCSAWDSSGA